MILHRVPRVSPCRAQWCTPQSWCRTAETGEAGVQGQLWLYSKFKAIEATWDYVSGNKNKEKKVFQSCQQGSESKGACQSLTTRVWPLGPAWQKERSYSIGYFLTSTHMPWLAWHMYTKEKKLSSKEKFKDFKPKLVYSPPFPFLSHTGLAMYT